MADAAVTSIRREHERRGQQASDLYQESSSILDACGVFRSGSWIRRTVNRYLDAPVQGLPFGSYLVARVNLNDQQRRRLAERADLRYLLTYADPTGETAIRNVAKRR